ncbi:potassium channel, sub T, member 2 [Geranomyces variabilis]|uniref:Potassium channel, sub T, member 2 n=1 Tax=Geranomyces variabilis TaxID=109894 RepID=A0AAD5TTE3_9FUNG|nr:potassium channel, sub T, member 2 [Geranomyces variabilis]
MGSATADDSHQGGGGLLNALVHRRSNNRQNPNHSTSRLWPGAAANSSTTKGLFHARKRSQAVDPSVSLQGLKADREEVQVTAHKHKNPFRPFVPSPFLRQRTGLSLVRTNYSIRKASIRQNEKADYARADGGDNEKQGVDDTNREDFRKLDAKFHVTSYAHNVVNITQSRGFAMLFVYLDLTVDLLLCALYVYQISSTNPLSDAPTPFWLFIERPRWLYLVLLVLNFYNLASYLIRISVTNEKRRALMSYHPVIDLLTTVPFVVSLFISHGQYLYVPYYLRCWYIIWRSNRAMSVHMDVDADLGTVSVNPLRHQLIILLSFLTAILFTMAAAFQWSEMMFSQITYSAIDVLYFSLVTAATVGYGDISPNHWVSRLLVIVILLVILSIVPGLISDFLDTWNLNRESSKGFTAGTHEHVILIGNFTNPNRVQDLLNGFLDIRNTRTPNRHVVIFGPGEAPLAVQNLLALPFYRTCTTYLQGDALDERNYGRMDSGTASAAFVLSNRRATDWFEEDQNTTLTAWSFHIHNPSVPLYTEVLLPETAAFHQMTEMVICVDQIKQVVLACNCLHVGVSTFIMNLIFQSNPSNACSLAWEFQYSDGLANEIYHAEANPVLVGKSFAFVSWFLYVEFQVVLFAVRPENGAGELLLNPGRAYSIQKDDVCYYIAHHTTDLENIQGMTEAEMLRAMKQYGVAPLSQDVTLDVIDVPEGERENGDAKPAEDFKILNASDGDDDDKEDGIHTVKKKKENKKGGAQEKKPSSSPPQPPPPASHENIRKLEKVLPPAATHLIAQLTDGTYIGRPESPHSSIPEDQPPFCRLLKTPLTNRHQCILDDATHLRDHTLVCAGEQPLFRFMCTLRSAAIPTRDMRTILILGADEPTDEEFHSTLAVFPEVKYMVGDCRRKRDMLRAGVEHAHTVLIMSKPENAFKGSPDQRQPRNAVEDMSSSKADSAACLATHVVHQILAGKGICVNGMRQRGGRDVGGAGDDGGTRGEATGDGDGPASTGDLGIVGPVKQLEGRAGGRGGDRRRGSSSSETGSVLLPADGASVTHSHHGRTSSVSSGTSDNDKDHKHPHHRSHRPHRTITVVTELLDRKNIRFLHALVSPASIIDHLHSPTYASGHAVVSALIDNFVYAVYENASTIDIVKGMCGDLRDRPGQNSSCLTTAGWEEWMEGKPFEEIYRVLAVERGVIPVAVIRAPDEALGNELPFIYTNPVASLMLAKGDRLFVL